MYSQQIADDICARIAEGVSLRTAAQEHGTKHSTFLLWCSENDELADQYTRARATGADAEFEELGALQEEQPPTLPSGAVDTGWVAWRRLQVDTKKWELSKKAAKKYGDKIETTHEVGDSIRAVVREIVKPGA
jgi:hypothetical protein